MDITRALQAAVRGYPHGTKSLAAALGMQDGTLSHKVSPTYQTQWCSPEEMLRIMEITGDDGPLLALADARNYVLLPRPVLAGDATDECMARMLDCIKEFSEFTQEIAADLADDKVKDNELRRIEKEGAEAIAAIHRMMAWAQAKHEAAKPAHLRSVA